MLRKNLYYCLIILMLHAWGCGNHKRLDDTVVLRVGPVEVTRYEFEKNLERFQKMYQQQHKCKASKDTVNAWIENFLDEQILLANAYDLGINECDKIQKTFKRCT